MPWLHGPGNGIIIYNPISREYDHYLHFSSLTVQVGDVIEAGQIIGIGGNTGRDARKDCCGEHVHFETHGRDEKGEFVVVQSSDLRERLDWIED